MSEPEQEIDRIKLEDRVKYLRFKRSKVADQIRPSAPLTNVELMEAEIEGLSAQIEHLLAVLDDTETDD